MLLWTNGKTSPFTYSALKTSSYPPSKGELDAGELTCWYSVYLMSVIQQLSIQRFETPPLRGWGDVNHPLSYGSQINGNTSYHSTSDDTKDPIKDTYAFFYLSELYSSTFSHLGELQINTLLHLNKPRIGASL